MLAVHCGENDKMGKIDRILPPRSSWMNRVYWYCPLCKERLHGSDDRLHYFYTFDFVFHKLDESTYHRVFELLPDGETLRTYQYDEKTGTYSVPQIEIKSNGEIVRFSFAPREERAFLAANVADLQGLEDIGWYSRFEVKETVSEYVRNRLVQLATKSEDGKSIFRRYDRQGKPYFNPTAEEVPRWIQDSGLTGVLGSIATVDDFVDEQTIDAIRPHLDRVDLVFDVDSKSTMALSDLKAVAKLIVEVLAEIGFDKSCFLTNSRRAANNLHVQVPGRLIPRLAGVEPDEFVRLIGAYCLQRIARLAREKYPHLVGLLTPTANSDAEVTVSVFCDLTRPFPVPLSLYWKKSLERGTFICPFPPSEIDNYDPSWASTETPNFGFKDCWKIEREAELSVKAVAEIFAMRRELEHVRTEGLEGWEPPAEVNKERIAEAIRAGKYADVLCPALVRSFTFSFEPGHRRPVMALLLAELKGLGFEDNEVTSFLKQRNKTLGEPLDADTLADFVRAELQRYGVRFGPPGCELIQQGGGALFDGIQMLSQECENCPFRERVTHPIWATMALLCPSHEVKRLGEQQRQVAIEFLRQPELWQQFMETTDRWISHDERTRRNIWRTYVSAQTPDPMTHSLLGRDSIGKTYDSVNVARLVPDEYIWYLAGLSPTSLAHDYGEWDKERKGFVITLDQRILLFLEPPSDLTLQKLRPILSHDRREVEYKFTDRSAKGGLRTIKTFVCGHPAFLMLGVKQHKGGEQTSRWFTETPEISRFKTRDVLLKSAEKQKNPDAFEDDETVSLWKDAYRLLAEQFPIRVKVPFADTLAKHWAIRGPESSRHFNMFCRLVKANAAFHFFQREKEGDYILASAEDFDDVLSDFRDVAAPSFLGVSGDAFALYKALLGGSKHVELAYEDIAAVARETFGTDTAENTLREFYIRALRDAGLLAEKDDPMDRRRKLYDLVPRDLQQIQVFDDEQRIRDAVKTGADYNFDQQEAIR